MAKQSKSDWPAWRYDPKTGLGKVFKSEADVPKGWVDDPQACAFAPAPRGHFESFGGTPPKKAPEPAPEPDVSSNKGLAKEHGLTKRFMQTELEGSGIEYDKKLSVDDLAAFYLSLPDEEDDEDGPEDEDDLEDDDEE